MGERSLHTREVAGSKPAAPIARKARYGGLFRLLGGLLISHRNVVRGSTGPITGAQGHWWPRIGHDHGRTFVAIGELHVDLNGAAAAAVDLALTTESA